MSEVPARQAEVLGWASWFVGSRKNGGAEITDKAPTVERGRVYGKAWLVKGQGGAQNAEHSSTGQRGSRAASF